MTTTLLEYAARGRVGRVDRAAGIIYDVRIIGSDSKNNRTYPRETLRRAAALYENRPVHLNHSEVSTPGVIRSVESRIGWLEGVRFQDNALVGNLCFLKSDPLADKLCEMAERNPSLVGLSHNAEGRVSRRGDRVIVDELVAVRSVDLVSDPATTSSLFESVRPSTTAAAAGGYVPPADTAETARRLLAPARVTESIGHKKSAARPQQPDWKPPADSKELARRLLHPSTFAERNL